VISEPAVTDTVAIGECDWWPVQGDSGPATINAELAETAGRKCHHGGHRGYGGEWATEPRGAEIRQLRIVFDAAPRSGVRRPNAGVQATSGRRVSSFAPRRPADQRGLLRGPPASNTSVSLCGLIPIRFFFVLSCPRGPTRANVSALCDLLRCTSSLRLVLIRKGHATKCM